MKIAIIGSREWSNTRKIKDLLSSLKQKFGDELVIISGGAKDGADMYVKKYAIEFGLNYQEYNPAHTPRNLYSAMPDSYYDKPYHVTQFHHRNMLIAQACDKMVALVPGDKITNGTRSAIKYAQKLDKPVVILS